MIKRTVYFAIASVSIRFARFCSAMFDLLAHSLSNAIKQEGRGDGFSYRLHYSWQREKKSCTLPLTLGQPEPISITVNRHPPPPPRRLIIDET